MEMLEYFEQDWETKWYYRYCVDTFLLFCIYENISKTSNEPGKQSEKGPSRLISLVDIGKHHKHVCF